MKRQGKATSAWAATGGHGIRRALKALALTSAGLVIAVPTAFAALPGQGFLPNNRAWELVSPPDKNGSDVLVNTSRIRAAETDQGLPMALMFSSLGSFSDVDGAANATDYLSQRTLAPGTRGWATHNVYPPQPPPSGGANIQGGEGLYVGDPSSDLTKAVFRAYASLPGTPAEVSKVTNLYLRTDLRNPGDGFYQLLTGCTFSCSVGSDFSGEGVRFLGGSPDLGRALFSAKYQLTEDAPASNPILYKAVGGVANLVGYIPVSPATQCTGVEPGCQPATAVVPGAAGGDSYAPHVLSSDGTRAFFTVGSFPGQPEGEIFVRDDRGTATLADDTTTQVNASERSSPTPPRPATYWDASATGTRAFFVSPAALTDDAPADTETPKLYRWSLAPEAEGHHLTYISVDHQPADGLGEVLGTLGVSTDGGSVYFLQRGQVAAGQPALGSRVGIYSWHSGDGSRYIGEMVDEADALDDLGGPSRSFLDPQLGARVTPDGGHMLLSLRQPPSPGGPDHGNCPGDGGTEIEGRKGCRQLYLHDLEREILTCVSCDPDGTVPTTPAFFSLISLPSLSTSTDYLNRPISEDGRFVFFSTGESLVATDANGVADAYVFDTASGEARLLSSGESRSPSYFAESSANGRDAFILTRQRLSAWDVDGNQDLYDARVDGGVPEPLPDPPACNEDLCQPLPDVSSEAEPASILKGAKATRRHKFRRCTKRHRRAEKSGGERVRRPGSKACAKKRRRGEGMG